MLLCVPYCLVYKIPLFTGTGLLCGILNDHGEPQVLQVKNKTQQKRPCIPRSDLTFDSEGQTQVQAFCFLSSHSKYDINQLFSDPDGLPLITIFISAYQ